MEELRAGQKVSIKTSKISVNGTVEEIEIDRVVIAFDENETQQKALQECDTVEVLVYTKSGIKKMHSMIIDNNGHKLELENAPTIAEEQRRENVRINVPLKIFIHANDALYPATTLDLSAGGVRFELTSNVRVLDNSNEIRVRFIDTAFEDEFTVNAVMLKTVSETIYVAKFENNSDGILQTITRFCMRNVG